MRGVGNVRRGRLPLDSGTVTPLSDSDSGVGTDAQAALAVTAPGVDAATGTDAGSVNVTASNADASTGTDAGSVSASVPGADAATGTDTGGAPSVTGAGGESGSGTDTGAVSATLASSDAASGTDAGTVDDITGGPTPVSGSDSGTATDSGTASVTAAGTDAATATDAATLLDLTAAEPEPEPETGPTGGRYEPGGDESSIYGQPTESLRDTDIGVGVESAEIVDLTPRRTLELPLRLRRSRSFSSGDTATAQDEGAVLVMRGAADSGQVVKESSFVEVIDDPRADADDAEFLMMLTLSDL